MNPATESWTLGILVGGQSRRMGQSKALLSVGDETLLERTIDRLKLDSDEVVLSVSTSSQQIPDALLTLRAATDRVAGEGPLMGVESLLEAATTPWVVVVPCDMPFLRGEQLQELLNHRQELSQHGAVHFEAVDHPRPFPLVIHRDCLPTLRSLMKGGKRRLMELLKAIPTVGLPLDDQGANSVDFNVNTPDDLAEWRTREDGGCVDGNGSGC